MTDESWVKLYRKMTEWGWYKDIPCKVVFLHLILTVRYKKYEYCGVLLEPGEIMTGRNQLADATGLTAQQVRTALKKLQKTQEITVRSTHQCSIIKLTNWRQYQILLNTK